MLSQFYRFLVVNNSGSTITWTSGTDGRMELNVDGWFIDPTTGKITYTNILALAESPDFDGGTENIVNGAEAKWAEIDNTSNLFLGAQVQLKVTHDEGLAADGTFDIYVDGGRLTGNLSSDQSGYVSAEANFLEHIGSLVWEPNAANDDIMLSKVFNI